MNPAPASQTTSVVFEAGQPYSHSGLLPVISYERAYIHTCRNSSCSNVLHQSSLHGEVSTCYVTARRDGSTLQYQYVMKNAEHTNVLYNPLTSSADPPFCMVGQAD